MLPRGSYFQMTLLNNLVQLNHLNQWCWQWKIIRTVIFLILYHNMQGIWNHKQTSWVGQSSICNFNVQYRKEKYSAMKTDFTKCNQNGRLLRGCRQEYSPVNFKEMQKIIFKKKPGKALAKLKDFKDSHI